MCVCLPCGMWKGLLVPYILGLGGRQPLPCPAKEETSEHSNSKKNTVKKMEIF